MNAGPPTEGSAARLARALIGLASLLIPSDQRDQWRREWESEVWHQLRDPSGATASGLGTVLRCLGSFRHAAWIRLRAGIGMTALGTDLRQAVRSLVRSPLFATTAIGTLALGIGASTAAFSILHSVLLAPLPYPDEDELVAVVLSAPGIDQPEMSSAPFLHFTYVEQNRSFQAVGLWRGQSVTVTGRGNARRVPAIVASAEVLPVLGVAPTLGREFDSGDTRPESAPTVILAHGYWQRELGEDPAALGQTLVVDGVPHQIVGVLPSDFRFVDEDVELILPYRFDPARVWLGGFGFRSLARLRPGVTLEEASADVARMIAIAIETTPPPDGGSREAWAERLGLQPNLRTLREEVVGRIGGTLWLLVGVVGLVLVIASANVANLVLVRGETRRAERGIRSALGAGRIRIARGQVLEGLVMGVAAAAGGLAIASAFLPVFIRMAPATLPRASQIAIDAPVVLLGTALALFLGAFLGALPVLQVRRDSTGATIGSLGRSTTMSRAGHRALGGLVVVQVALSMVLLVGSGLMLRTYRAIADVDPGFDSPSAVGIARVSIPEGIADGPAAFLLQEEIRDRIEAIPGIESVGYASSAPMEATANPSEGLLVEGVEYVDGSVPVLRRFEFVSPGFFETIGTDLLAGRPLSAADLATERPVALVSETLARQEWGTAEAAIGRRIRSSTDEPWREVIGVVQNVYDDGPHLEPPATAYFPIVMVDFWGSSAFVWRENTFVARGGAVGTEGFIRALQEAVLEVSPDLPLGSVELLSDLESRTLSRHSLLLTLLTVAGAISFFMGVVGLYGVLEYSASLRVREIGLRMALGAERAILERTIVGRGVALALLGVLIGVPIASLATRLLSSFLFQTSAVDTLTFGVVSLALIGTAAVASYQPARRATRVSPVIAMRPD